MTANDCPLSSIKNKVYSSICFSPTLFWNCKLRALNSRVQTDIASPLVIDAFLEIACVHLRQKQPAIVLNACSNWGWHCNKTTRTWTGIWQQQQQQQQHELPEVFLSSISCNNNNNCISWLRKQVGLQLEFRELPAALSTLQVQKSWSEDKRVSGRMLFCDSG